MTGALTRYVLADALRAERWAGPVLLYLAGTTAFDVGLGSALSCYSFTASLLLPVSLWLTIAIGNSEDQTQAAITIVTVGSPLRVLLAKLLTGYLVSLPLAGFGVLWALITAHPVTPTALIAGAGAHLLCALLGVAAAAPLIRPVLDRLAWVVFLSVGLVLAETTIPGCPPVRSLLVLFAHEPLAVGPVAATLSLITLETAALATVLIAAGHRLGRYRR
ncbi:MAG TPA: hypothetical protein VMU51_39215 [Mycobacteriales bacterium]|nr:hypothetical protein [Mycobacteriales bacterium]